MSASEANASTSEGEAYLVTKEQLLLSSYSSLLTKGVYNKIVQEELAGENGERFLANIKAEYGVANANANALLAELDVTDSTLTVHDALAKLSTASPDKNTTSLAKLLAENPDMTVESTSSVTLGEIVDEERQIADSYDLALSSVLGVTTPLNAAQKTIVEGIYKPYDGEHAVPGFLQYMGEDRLQRDINEIVLSSKNIVDNNTSITIQIYGIVERLKNLQDDKDLHKALEKLSRIALVLARNHDLCRKAYSSETPKDITSYTLNVCIILIRNGISEGIINDQYRFVYGKECEYNFKDFIVSSQQTQHIVPFNKSIIGVAAGGKQHKKKTTKPTKKKTSK